MAIFPKNSAIDQGLLKIENQGLQNDANKQMITAVRPLLDQMYEEQSRTCFAAGGSYKKAI